MDESFIREAISQVEQRRQDFIAAVVAQAREELVKECAFGFFGSTRDLTAKQIEVLEELLEVAHDAKPGYREIDLLVSVKALLREFRNGVGA